MPFKNWQQHVPVIIYQNGRKNGDVFKSLSATNSLNISQLKILPVARWMISYYHHYRNYWFSSSQDKIKIQFFFLPFI